MLYLNNTLRPCLVETPNSEYKGVFHGFYEPASVNQLYAIVELDNGKLITAFAYEIKFLNEEKPLCVKEIPCQN